MVLCLWAVFMSVQGKQPCLFGMRFFYVVTGSMEPTIHAGAAIVTKEAPDGQYQVGDIITFVSSVAEINGKPNTHRIISVDDSGGQRLYYTQGDANNTPDQDPVRIEDIYGKVVWNTGRMQWFGTLLGFISTRLGFATVIMIPILLITIGQIRNFTEEYKKALREAAGLPPENNESDEKQ